MKGLEMRAGSGGFEKDRVSNFTSEGNGNQMLPIPAAENSNVGLQMPMQCSFPNTGTQTAVPHGGFLEDGFSFQETETLWPNHIETDIP